MVSLARIDGRFPITLPILHKSLSLASDLSLSPYELCLFRAMASLALYAFLRVGEMAATNNNKSLLSIDNIAKLVNASIKPCCFPQGHIPALQAQLQPATLFW